MNLEDFIEEIILKGIFAFKKIYKNCNEAKKLNRHESIVVDGYEFKYWREYAIYKIAQYISELSPTAKIEINLNGNESTLLLEVTPNEHKELTRKLYLIIEKISK